MHIGDMIPVPLVHMSNKITVSTFELWRLGMLCEDMPLQMSLLLTDIITVVTLKVEQLVMH